MAKLPGAESLLGGGVSLDSGRPIATFDGTAIGRGMQQFGQGLENTGSNLMNYATTLKDKNDQVLMHDATQRYADFKTTQAQKAADAAVNMPPGGAGVLDTFIPQYQKDADAFAATVPEKFRPQFNAEIHSFAGTLTTSLHGDVLKEQSRFNGQQQDDFTNKRISTAALDPTNKVLTVQQLQDAGNNIRINPKLTPIEKQERLHSLAQEFAAHIGQAMNESKDGKAAITATGVGGDYFDKVRGKESGGSDTASSGVAVGRYQFTSGTWQQMAKDHPDLGLTPDGRTDPGQQEKAMRALTTDNIKSLQSNGVDPTEKNVYMAHFLGSGGASSFIKQMQSDPSQSAASAFPKEAAANKAVFYDRRSGAALSLSQVYANQTSRFTGDAVNVAATSGQADPYNTGYKYYRDRFGDGVDPSVLDALAKGYVTGLNQDKAETKANILQASQDAPAAYSNSGQYTGPQPSRSDFAQAYGAEGENKYAQYVAGNDAAKSAFDMRTEPVSAIQATVEAAHAQAVGTTGEGAGLAEARYNALSQAAEATMKARLSDPVGFTMQAFPKTVGADWAAYRANPTPEGYAKAIASTTAAQDQIALPAQSRAYLPGDVAKNAASVFKDQNLPAQQRIGAVVSTVLGTNDAGQQRSIFQQLVKEGLPPETEAAIEAYADNRPGAGEKIMNIVMADPKDLPQKLTETPEAIKDAIHTSYGDLIDSMYGTGLGDAANIDRAGNGTKVMVKSVQFRLAAGEPLDDAVKGTMSDMFGDKDKLITNPINGVAFKGVVPVETDMTKFGDGLDSAWEKLDKSMRDSASGEIARTLPNVPPTVAAAYKANAGNMVSLIENGGHWRNYGDKGFVFINQYRNKPVSDAQGNPIVFGYDDIMKMGGERVTAGEKSYNASAPAVPSTTTDPAPPVVAPTATPAPDGQPRNPLMNLDLNAADPTKAGAPAVQPPPGSHIINGKVMIPNDQHNGWTEWVPPTSSESAN